MTAAAGLTRKEAESTVAQGTCDCHAKAIEYARLGLSVIPIVGDGTKKPAVSWKPYQTTAPTADQVDEWFDARRHGMAVIAGRVSGGIELLEFEGRAIEEGVLDRFYELCVDAGLGELVKRVADGCLNQSPRGGFHLILRTDSPIGNQKLARRPATEAELAPDPKDDVRVLIETRGEGGYFIVPPSHGRTSDVERPWKRIRGGFDTVATLTPDERDALYDVARSLDRLPVVAARAPRTEPAEAHGDRPGDWYNAQPDVEGRIEELLVGHGWSVVSRRGTETFLRRPGKDRGVSATIGCHPGLFYVFSTSTIFEAPRGYDAFGVYAILVHDGDFSAAGRAIREQYDLGDSWPPLIRQNGQAGPATYAESEPPEPPDVGTLDIADPPIPWPDPPGEAAFHGVLGDIVRAVAPHTEADPVAILGTLLAMFGTACGTGRYLYQGSMQGANLSLLLVGETGFKGRKGTALDVAREVFRLAYPEIDDLWLVGVASGEAIAGHLMRKREQQEERVLIVETEFARLLTIMNREGSTLGAVLRNAWDGVPLGHARARDESLVTRHHVTLLGHVTPAELRQKLTDVDTANGFANRLLFLVVRRSHVIALPESADRHVTEHVRPLRDAIFAAHAPREMHFDADARLRWVGFYADMSASPRLGLAGAITGRHEAQVARLALVYALADRSDAVGVDHLEAAIALAEYARRSAIHALGDSTGNRHADALRRMLADGPVSRDGAKRELGLRTAADLDAAIAVLVDAGLAEVVTVGRPKGGRPVRHIRAVGSRANGANGANGAGGTRPDEEEIAT